MTTILTVGNSEGSRACDGKCHQARHPECSCICAGRYHGKGWEAPVMLTRDLEQIQALDPAVRAIVQTLAENQAPVQGAMV